MSARTSDEQTQPLLTADRLKLILHNAISTLIALNNAVPPVTNGHQLDEHEYAAFFHHPQTQPPLTADDLKRLLSGTVSALIALNNALAPILDNHQTSEQGQPAPHQSQGVAQTSGQNHRDAQTNDADGAQSLPVYSNSGLVSQPNTSDDRAPGFDTEEGMNNFTLGRVDTPEDARSQRVDAVDHVMDETSHRDGAVQGSSLPYALFPPADPPRHRNARHLAPMDVQFSAHPHPEVRPPIGTDRRDIAKNWNAGQREDLFKIGKKGAWMRSERFRLPAKLRQLLLFLQGLNRTVFAGQSPVTATLPLPTESGVEPDSLFLNGTEEQIAFLTNNFTWSSPWVCVQIFPNEDLPCDFAGTFGGAQIELKDHDKVRGAVTRALEESAPFHRFVLSAGADPLAVIKTLRIEVVVTRQGGSDVRFWNVFLASPDQTKFGPVNFRDVIAGIRPHHGLREALFAFPDHFLCGTCGCITHPSGICPTITARGWMGFIPSLQNNRPAPASTFTGALARSAAVNNAYVHATKKGRLSQRRRM
ncbi:hypothetical protein AURDEDRAFT_164473 [Auricularia subglabra TFB-10046 SS5]|nr:hypothetical protein AURDEDRAFT_164473 [Auricularia subglabra TFB-10046 SS5]